MNYDIPNVLRTRLLQYGYTDVEITQKIKEYSNETRDYISLVLSNIPITDGQFKIIAENYIQYKLFSMIEMESFVEDKRTFLDDLISTIKKDYKDRLEIEKEKSVDTQRIRVW